MSTWPVAIAFCGISWYSASFGSCAIVMPPLSFTRLKAAAPSEPVPDITMPIACVECESASVWKNWSTVTIAPPCILRSFTRSVPSNVCSCLPGAITYTWFFSMGAVSVICSTGMPVWRCRIWPAVLACSADRCRITTNAMSIVFGALSKKLIRACRPPADAPMPTTGNCNVRGPAADVGSWGVEGGALVATEGCSS